MSLKAIAATLLIAAATPLPELRTEAIDGGSVFHIRNIADQALTAYLIELVNYPGSRYALWQDQITDPLAPGGVKRIQVVNMTVGAVPDYVKLQAAIYADGTTAGIPEKIAQLLDRRRATLKATRDLIARLEKSPSKTDLIAELQKEAAAPPPLRGSRPSQEATNNAAANELLAETAQRLNSGTVEDVLTALRARERALAASRPAP